MPGPPEPKPRLYERALPVFDHTRRSFHAIVCSLTSGRLSRSKISGSTSCNAPCGMGKTMHIGSSLPKRTVPGRVICQFIVNG